MSFVHPVSLDMSCPTGKITMVEWTLQSCVFTTNLSGNRLGNHFSQLDAVQKSRIQETKNLLACGVSRINTIKT